MKTDLLIGSEWRASAKRYCLTNPATEEPLAEVAEAGEAEVDAAVRAARACLDSKGISAPVCTARLIRPTALDALWGGQNCFA